MGKKLLQNPVQDAREAQSRSILDPSLLRLTQVRRGHAGPEAEAPPRETSRSEAEPEPAHLPGDDTVDDEDSSIRLCPRSHRTIGPAVTNIEVVLEGRVEKLVTRSETVSEPATPSHPEVVPLRL